jgi:uncharacterized protein (TIGR03382 family)
MKFPSYGAAGVLAACLLSTPALASRGGINSYSGKGGMTCNTAGCHQAGAAVPTVEISGPKTLAAEEKGQYQLIIRGGPASVGGTNIAASTSAAALDLVAGSGLRKVGSELTHTAPKAFSGGELRFDFTMIAPSTAGTVTLFGAGNSGNGDNTNSGDGIATTTLAVTITGGTGGTGGGTDPDDGDDDAAGCSATGGAPMLLLALSALTLSPLRRRRS